MYIDEHCKHSIEVFGEPFTYVHEWLDELAKYDILRHRAYRHHKEGIEIVRKKYGNMAADAARLHIMDDWGFIPDREWYKKNSLS